MTTGPAVHSGSPTWWAGMRARAAATVRRKSRSAWLFALLLLSASVGALGAAVNQTNAEQLVFRVIIGAAIGTLGLLIVGALVGQDDEGTPRFDHPAALAVITSGGVVAWLGAWTESVTVAPAGLMIAIVGILMLTGRSSVTIERSPALWLGYGLSLIVVAIVPMTAASVNQTMWAILVAIVGLAVAKLAFSPYLRLQGAEQPGPDPEAWAKRVSLRGQRALVVSLGLAVGGAVLVGVSSLAIWQFGRPLVVAIGAVAVVVGLSGAGLAGLTIGRDKQWSAGPGIGPLDTWSNRRGRWLTVGVLGLVALAVGAGRVWVALETWRALAVLLVVLTAALGIFFVLRGEGVVILVTFGFLLAWVLVDRDTDPFPEIELGTPTIVALGDSFVSGQGADDYVPYTNSVDEMGNSCRRSMESFPVLLAGHYGQHVANVACNGAETADLHLVGQKSNTDAEVPGALPQLDNLHAMKDDIELALVTVGGNDAGFAKIVAACLLPTDCTEQEKTLRAQLRVIGDELEATYLAILERIPDAPVVVVPYPLYVGLGCKNEALALEEREFAFRFIHDLNKAIKGAVTEIGDERLHFFPDLDRAYLNHTLCDDEPGANLAHLLPRDGPVVGRLSPTTWHDGSAHPTPLGHRCTAAALVRWLDEQDGISLTADRAAEAVSSEDCPGVTADDPTLTELSSEVLARGPSDADIEQEIHPGKDCARSPTDPDACFQAGPWVGDQLNASLTLLGPALAAILAGGMLVGLALARLRWTLFDFLAPELPVHPGDDG